jgi:hypothetical protein
MGYGYAFSQKAAANLNKKLAVLRGTRPQKGKMAAFNRSEKDEGSRKKAEIPAREINHPTNQRDRIGSTPSKGGQARGGVTPKRSQIDQGAMQGKKWIPGGGVSAANPKTGNVKMKGPIAKSGGPYGGGGRATQ